MHWLGIKASKLLPNYLTSKAKNCCRFVDSYYHIVAVTVSDSLFPVQADNTLIMNNSEQIASKLSCLQLEKLLTLR
jgi:hypothetical protein